MERDVGLVAHDPAVVSRRDVKHVSRTHDTFFTAIHGDHGPSGDDHANVLHLTAGRAGDRSGVMRPPPPRLVGGPADRETAAPHHRERTLVEGPRLVRALEPLDLDEQPGLLPPSRTISPRGLVHLAGTEHPHAHDE